MTRRVPIQKPKQPRYDELCADVVGVLTRLAEVPMPRAEITPDGLSECGRCHTRQPARRDRCELCAASKAAQAACPRPSRWLVEDGIVDEVAVERAVRGGRVSLTLTERDEAVRRVAGSLSDVEVADLLGVSDRTVQRIRYRFGLPPYKGSSYEVLERRGTANRAGLRSA